MNPLLIALIGISLLPAAALAHNNDHHAEQPEVALPSAQVLAPLAIHYEINTGKQISDWFIVRENTAITTYNQQSMQGEIWSKDATGEIEHQRIFSEDKRIIDYTSGELKALHKMPEWNRLASIFSPAKVNAMHKTAETDFQGKLVEVRDGLMDGVQTTVWWIPELQIPAKIEQWSTRGKSIMTLKEMHQKKPDNWKWLDEKELTSYLRIDASDFGDMENDPFVQKVMALDGQSHHVH